MLRGDTLMAMHDANIAGVYGCDKLHQFAWTVDACARDGRIDDLSNNWFLFYLLFVE
jgi:hypothetical protein